MPCTADSLAERIAELANLLHACVHDGANIGFVLPFSLADAETFWRDSILPAVGEGSRLLWLASVGNEVAGSVQLHRAMPANQRHRGEVSKLMVHPEFRRRGVARALMAALEVEARRYGCSLLTLDTRSGSEAEPLYRSLGYETSGVIPGYCRDPFEARLDPTTVMYKAL